MYSAPVIDAARGEARNVMRVRPSPCAAIEITIEASVAKSLLRVSLRVSMFFLSVLITVGHEGRERNPMKFFRKDAEEPFRGLP